MTTNSTTVKSLLNTIKLCHYSSSGQPIRSSSWKSTDIPFSPSQKLFVAVAPCRDETSKEDREIAIEVKKAESKLSNIVENGGQ
jgi:hypothetical protein